MQLAWRAAFSLKKGRRVGGNTIILIALALLAGTTIAGCGQSFAVQLAIPKESFSSRTRSSKVPTEPAARPIIQNEAAQASWREDLNHLVTQMPRAHPNLFHTVSKADFERAISALDAQIAYLTDEQIIVELAEIVALISGNGRDGHTVLVPNDMSLYPIQLYWFSDGMHIIDAQEPYLHLIGSKVLEMGGIGVENLYNVFDPVLPRDNDMTIRWIMPSMMLVAELHRGLGIISSSEPMTVTVAGPNGGERVEVLYPISVEAYGEWKDFPYNSLPQQDSLIYLRNPRESFWSAFMEDSRTLFIQYNAVESETQSGESLNQFSRRIADFLDQNEVQRVVVDLRHNYGGDDTTYGALLRLFSQHAMFQEPGTLFTIIGRQTFSAAGTFATEMDRYTRTLFVGEPTGSAPNHYGDNKPLVLPRTQTVVLISSRFHQPAAPGDERLWIPPDIPVELSSADYFGGRDPALEAIFDRSG